MSEVRAGSSEVRVTATEELRRMLDERGVEWRERVWGGKHSVVTFWHARGVRWHYRENRFGELRLHADGLVPEQAIDATLGRGTCHDVCEDDGYFKCSVCGGKMHGWTEGDVAIRYNSPAYCPNCGARVIEN